MRISDWSSDVCSSDLAEEMARAQAGRSDDPAVAAALAFALKVVEDRGQVGDADVQRLRDAGYGDEQVMEILAHVALNIFTNYTDRKSVVRGKRVSVRVDLGGRRIIKKKQKQINAIHD